MSYRRFLVRDAATGEIVARVAASPRHSALDACLRAGVPVRTRCRGSLVCGTCWVVVGAGFEALPAPGEEEQAMLDRVVPHEPRARLACQLHLPEGVDEVEITAHLTGPMGDAGTR